jgi:hypothetical protein
MKKCRLLFPLPSITSILSPPTANQPLSALTALKVAAEASQSKKSFTFKDEIRIATSDYVYYGNRSYVYT